MTTNKTNWLEVVHIWFSPDLQVPALSAKAEPAAILNRNIAMAGFYLSRVLTIALVVGVVIAVAVYTPVLSFLSYELGMLLLSAAVALGVSAGTGTPWFVFLFVWGFGVISGAVLASGSLVPVFDWVQAFYEERFGKSDSTNDTGPNRIDVK
jgi:hypothetical protein